MYMMVSVLVSRYLDKLLQYNCVNCFNFFRTEEDRTNTKKLKPTSSEFILSQSIAHLEMETLQCKMSTRSSSDDQTGLR